MRNMIFGDAPDFDRMMEAISELEVEINGTNALRG